MIRRIRGKVITLLKDSAVIEVSGWGVRVSLPSTLELTVGSEVILHTHLAVKQDGVELYGFIDERDLSFFTLALTVSGVGPKSALALLRRAPRESLEAAIQKRDVSYLTRVVGLGKKAAEKLVVELAEKIGSEEREHDDGDADVFDMLVALGYTEREARKALLSVPADVTGKDARFRAALSKNRA